MAITLSYLDSVNVFMRDGYFDWVDSARFAIRGCTSRNGARDVLEKLLVDDHYVNAYDYADNVAAGVHGRARETPTGSQLSDVDLQVMGVPPELRPRLTPAVDLHGPYVLSSFSVDTFDLINGLAARDALVEQLQRPETGFPAPTAIEGDLNAILDQLAAAQLVYRLQDLGEDAEHDYSSVLLPYLELVVIDLGSDELHLIASGGD